MPYRYVPVRGLLLIAPFNLAQHGLYPAVVVTERTNAIPNHRPAMLSLSQATTGKGAEIN